MKLNSPSLLSCNEIRQKPSIFTARKLRIKISTLKLGFVPIVVIGFFDLRSADSIDATDIVLVSPLGEYLSFASPKERYQRKGDPGSFESPAFWPMLRQMRKLAVR